MPLIRRIDEASGGTSMTAEEALRYRDMAQRAAQDPSARGALREFYRVAPWLYSESMQFKIASSRSVDPGLETFQRCRVTLDQALELGFDEEAAALAIGAARIAWRVFSTLNILQETAHPYLLWRQSLLEAYEGLSTLRTLPADDTAFWRDRFAEVVSALLPMVAAFNWPTGLRERALAAHPAVARVTARWIPSTPDNTLVPMRIAHYFPGGPARLVAALAHLEALGGQAEHAVVRLEPLLSGPIEEPLDQGYALVVSLGAARRAGRPDLQARWRDALLRWIDDSRRPFASFEGRLYAQQVTAGGFEYALRVWANANMHHADDLWTVAEGLKARILLDELAGHRTAPTDTSGTTPPVDEDEQQGGASMGAAARIGLVDLDSGTLAELTRTSYWTFGAGAGIEAAAPGEQRHLAAQQAELLSEMHDEDARRAARDGGLSGCEPAVPVEALRDALHADELLIEVLMPRDPFSPNREGWVIVAHREGSRCHGFYVAPQTSVQSSFGNGKYIERGPLSDLAARARSAIVNGDEAGEHEQLRMLFDLILQPVLDMGFMPEQFARWIIVPHGPLHLVPWSALPDADGRRLIERVALTTVPSASVWHRLQRAGSTPIGTMLAVGNPGPREGYAALPHAHAEATEAAHQLDGPGVAATLLTGEDATEAAVIAALTRAELAHFAAHGRLDPKNPRNGHQIVLALGEGRGGGDGALRASDVRALDLSRLQLALLDLCHGVFCRYGPGDEPLGLMSAFIAAGTHNVIGALWDLPDGEARQFALWFYEALTGDTARGDPAAALRAAARRAIAQGWPTAHWAGMVLVGPGRPLAWVASAARS